jgi:hypothetical protein
MRRAMLWTCGVLAGLALFAAGMITERAEARAASLAFEKALPASVTPASMTPDGTAMADAAQADPAQAGDAMQGAGHGAGQAASPSNPGPEQARLAELAGDYNREVKFVGPQGNGMPTSAGTCKISVILGGRFLMEESHDVVFGKPVDGLRLYGYNNATKQYEMARMYSMSTAITMMTGKSTDGGKTIDYDSADSAANGGMPLRAHLVRTSNDEFSVTMSTIGDDGKDQPFQETIYKRAK